MRMRYQLPMRSPDRYSQAPQQCWIQTLAPMV
jgi:hypothetical protein